MSVTVMGTTLWDVNVAAGTGSAEALEAQCDAVMNALLDIEATDPTLSHAGVAVDLGVGRVEITLAAEAEDYEAALSKLQAATHTAIVLASGSVRGGKPRPVGTHAELLPA